MIFMILFSIQGLEKKQKKDLEKDGGIKMLV